MDDDETTPGNNEGPRVGSKGSLLTWGGKEEGNGLDPKTIDSKFVLLPWHSPQMMTDVEKSYVHERPGVSSKGPSLARDCDEEVT